MPSVPALPVVERSSARRQRSHSPQKTKQVIDAAQRAFMEHGFDVSMDAIASAAGVSKATLYSRYRSKNEIFLAVLSQETERIAHLVDVPLASSDDPLAALIEGCTVLRDLLYSESHLALLRLVIGESVRFPECGERYLKEGPQKAFTHLAGFLCRSKLARTSAVAERMSQDIFYLVCGMLHLAVIAGMTDDAPRARKRLKVSLTNLLHQPVNCS